MTFAEAVREIILDCSRAPERPTPGLLAAQVGRQAERYLEHVRFDPTHYVRHPVLFFDDWEVMIIGWESGQFTPIHDHRGSTGGMVVLGGTLVEERFTTPSNRPELVDSRVRPEGDLCDTGPTVLHRLMPKTHAVSLHVYRPPLRTMGIWDSTGMLEIRQSQFEVPEEILGNSSPSPSPSLRSRSAP